MCVARALSRVRTGGPNRVSNESLKGAALWCSPLARARAQVAGETFNSCIIIDSPPSVLYTLCSVKPYRTHAVYRILIHTSHTVRRITKCSCRAIGTRLLYRSRHEGRQRRIRRPFLRLFISHKLLQLLECRSGARRARKLSARRCNLLGVAEELRVQRAPRVMCNGVRRGRGEGARGGVAPHSRVGLR